MQLYKKIPTYDLDTGIPINDRIRPNGYICDYCGYEFINDEEPYVRYIIRETGGVEPSYHYDRFILNGKNVDLYDMYDNNPEFIYCEQSCELRMIQDQLKVVDTNFHSLSRIMKNARYYMLENLPKDFNLERLNLKYVDY